MGPFRFQRTSQPQGAVGIDPRWASRRLVAAYNPALRLGGPSVGRYPLTLTGAVFAPGQLGIVWSGARSRSAVSSANYSTASGTPVTIIAGVTPSNSDVAIDAICAIGVDATNSQFVLYNNVISGGDILCSTNNSDYYTSSGAVSVGQRSVVAATYLGGGLSTSTVLIYRNGVQLSTTRIGGIHGNLAVASGPVRFAHDTSGLTRQYRGQIDFVYLFESALTPSEIVELSRNPWQLFQPIDRSIWVPTSVVSTLPTLSAATFVSATSSSLTPRVTATWS